MGYTDKDSRFFDHTNCQDFEVWDSELGYEPDIEASSEERIVELLAERDLNKDDYVLCELLDGGWVAKSLKGVNA